jgi:hypothetical protein
MGLSPRSVRFISLLVLLLGAACGKGWRAPSARQAPPVAVFRPPAAGIELRRGTEPRELVRIGSRGMLIGPAGGPLAWKLFSEPRRADEAWYFLHTYAPFVAGTEQGEINFAGQGRSRAGATEQRMILAWAREVAAEAAGSRAGAVYGLVLAWHQGSSSGLCSDLLLDLTGEAVATVCGGPGEARGRLDPAQLGKVYGWFDRLQPFQSGAEEQEHPGGSRTGALDTRVIFAGRGAHVATAAEQAEVQSFAAALFSELAARRSGAEAAPAAPAASAAKAAPADPSPSRLLLPATAVAPRAEEIPLQLPDKAPAPPPPAPAAPAPTSPPPP